MHQVFYVLSNYQSSNMVVIVDMSYDHFLFVFFAF